MRTLDERVSFLEGRMMEQSTVLAGIQSTMTALDQRITALDQRMQQGFARADERMDARFQALDSKMTKQFHWLIGILFTVLSALFIAAIFRR